MRISSSMIYEQGVRSLSNQTARLLHNQQMLSSGRRILAPSDDPVNAARALVVTEAKNINTQFATNQSNARNALELEEAQLSSVNDIMARIRELAVQAGDAALSSNDRKGISIELRARFDELMGIANATDGNGDYIFSGYMGSTKPFGGNVDDLLAASNTEVAYMGDDGQRRVQVSPTRFLEVSDSGNEIFRRVRNGNGYFVTDYSTVNKGSGTIDTGNVTDPVVWDALDSKRYEIKFWVDANALVPGGKPGDTYYDIVDTQPLLSDGVTANPNFGNSLITGAPAEVPTGATFPAGLRKYYENRPIALSTQPGDAGTFDLGASVLVSGAPANGDSFSLTPSTTQSVFKTLSNLIGALEGRTAGTLTGTAFVPNAAVDAGGGTLDLTVDGVTQTITIPAPVPGPSYSAETLAAAMNNAINTAFGSSVANASVVNGGLVITSATTGATSSVSVAAGTLAITDVFGTATPTSGKSSLGQVTLANEVGFALTNFDQANESILKVRSAIGSRLSELESLGNVNQDVDLRYQETLSNLQDLDYAKTISDFQMTQYNLEAAQKSFMQVTRLSLFSYL